MDLWYDYECQCWCDGALIVRCGHREPQDLCFACKHHGERSHDGADGQPNHREG